MSKLGERLNELRQERGITQQELADFFIFLTVQFLAMRLEPEYLMWIFFWNLQNFTTSPVII